MKKQIQHRTGMRRTALPAAQVEPVRDQPGRNHVTPLLAAPSVVVSARYIDSRLKQFCLR